MLISPEGHLIFVELKTETGRLTALQSAQIAMLRKYKQDVRVLYGRKDVEAFLTEIRGGDNQ